MIATISQEYYDRHFKVKRYLDAPANQNSIHKKLLEEFRAIIRDGFEEILKMPEQMIDERLNIINNELNRAYRVVVLRSRFDE